MYFDKLKTCCNTRRCGGPEMLVSRGTCGRLMSCLLYTSKEALRGSKFYDNNKGKESILKWFIKTDIIIKISLRQAQKSLFRDGASVLMLLVIIIIINHGSTTLGGPWRAPRVDSIPPYCVTWLCSFLCSAFRGQIISYLVFESTSGSSPFSTIHWFLVENIFRRLSFLHSSYASNPP